MKRIVVTGLGVVSPLGNTAEENWRRLSAGTAASGDAIASERASGFDEACRLADRSLSEALGQSGIDPSTAACLFSASKPLFDGVTWIEPDFLNQHVRARFRFGGEARNVVAACATGAYSIALGASWIEAGLCDAVVAGSVEPPAHPLIAAGFRQMGVLSSDGATRPFDRSRSGFVLGYGAGAVVLESEASAHARGKMPLAVLSGWALGADGHSAVAFNSNGRKIADVVDRAIGRAALPKESVRYVNAHGTATRLNDRIETQALQKAFGDSAERLMISATKSSTGHLLGASGSIEFIYTVLALRHRYVPPTAALEATDPECPLDYTPRQGHAAEFFHALSLSFGFGGPIGALVVSAS